MPKCKYLHTTNFGNGFFKAGIIKDNKPKHDVIRLWIKSQRKTSKTSVSIIDEKFDFTLDEAIYLLGTLQYAVAVYANKNWEEIRSWEYKRPKGEKQ